MKTLLLASSSKIIKDELPKLLDKPLNEVKIAYITTASNVLDDLEYLVRTRKELVEAGFQVEDIDVVGKSKNELRKILGDKDVVYVQGGDTHYLLKQVKESGFDVIIKELLDQGVVYVGASAGSYLACPNIELATMKADYGLKDFSALSLVPFLLKVHVTSETLPEIKKEAEVVSLPVRFLTDEQAFLVQDDKVTLVGEGEELTI